MEFSFPFVKYLSSTSLSHILNLYSKLHANSKDKYKNKEKPPKCIFYPLYYGCKMEVSSSELTLIPKLDL